MVEIMASLVVEMAKETLLASIEEEVDDTIKAEAEVVAGSTTHSPYLILINLLHNNNFLPGQSLQGLSAKCVENWVIWLLIVIRG